MAPPWRVVLLLFFAAGLNYGDRTAISSVFPLLRSDLGMTDVQLGAIGTAFLWSYAACSPLAGLLADRFSRSRMIVFSLGAWSLVTVLTGLATSTGRLLLTRGLLGMAECGYLPAATALIADHHRPATRGRALGVHLLGLSLGLMAGGALAGYLGETHGWRASFHVLGGLGLVLAVVCWFLLEDGPRREATVNAPRVELLSKLKRLMGTPVYLLIVAQAMLVSVGTWMFLNWMPLYFQETFNLSLTLAGFSGTFTLQLAAMLGILAGSTVSDFVARRGGEYRLLLMAAAFILGAPLLLVFSGQRSFTQVTVGVLCFALLRALGMANEPPALFDAVHADDRSTAQGLMNTMNTLAGGAGVFVAGLLKKDLGLGGVFAGVSGLMMLAGLLAFLAYRIKARPLAVSS